MSILDLIPNKWRKIISRTFFIVALIYIIPPFIFESFSDIFVNLPTAIFISKKLGLKLMTSLILTYTLLPLLLLWVSSIIYPSTDSIKIFNGRLTKIKNLIIRYINLVKRNKWHLVWALLSLIVLYKLLLFYSTQINMYVLT